MKNHPAVDDLRRWRGGRVDEKEMLAIADHLSTCRECVADGARHLGPDRAAIELCDEIEGVEEHPDVERDLFAFVDGTATPDQRREIDKHLAVCTFCHDSVADLRLLAAERQGPSVRPWLLALAASVVIAVASVVWLRMMPAPRVEMTPQISRAIPTPQPVDEAEAFARTIRNGAPMAMPERLRSILGEADVLRGTSAATATFTPAGVVVTSARPQFTWPAPPGSRSVVEIFSGETEVMRSPPLETARWLPTRELPRGVTYAWTVRVERDGTTQILPSAPSPIARFHVLDGTTREALETAERRHGEDHFLLGVVYARAGVEDAARAHLELVTDPADTAVARRVLRELDSWRFPRQ